MAFRASQTALKTALRASRARPTQLALQQPRTLPALQGVRWTTGQVSGQPGSKDFKEWRENAKEEAAQVKHDIQEAISGDKESDHTPLGEAPIKEQIASLGELQPEKMPRGAFAFGALGVVPYAVTSATTIYLSHQASAAVSGKGAKVDPDTALALLHHVENLQLGYGALILSFIGALHWGFEFAGYNGHKGTPRYLLGIAPVLAAMPTVVLEGELGLATQFAAFTGAWFLDRQATQAGWTPRWYSIYRFWLTLAVGTSLVLTLGGTNYFGPSSKTVTTGRKLAELNERETEALRKREHAIPEESERVTGKVGGDVSIEASGDSYGLLVNKKKKEEERKQKEEEERKQKMNDGSGKE